MLQLWAALRGGTIKCVVTAGTCPPLNPISAGKAITNALTLLSSNEGEKQMPATSCVLVVLVQWQSVCDDN